MTGTTTLLRRSWLSADTFELELTRPAGFQFVPGQGVRLSRDGPPREYSLVSAPQDESLSVCVQRVRNGAFSPVLAGLEEGSSLRLTGPHGYLAYKPGGPPAVFVATGTGIAPFVSMVRAGARGFTLLHGAATSRDLYYRSVVQPAAAAYVACLSRERSGESVPGGAFAGRVTEYLRTRLAPGTFDFYLCGRGEMVRDVIGIVDERFAGSRVFFEIFF